jgi:hypothetical protein
MCCRDAQIVRRRSVEEVKAMMKPALGLQQALELVQKQVGAVWLVARGPCIWCCGPAEGIALRYCFFSFFLLQSRLGALLLHTRHVCLGHTCCCAQWPGV